MFELWKIAFGYQGNINGESFLIGSILRKANNLTEISVHIYILYPCQKLEIGQKFMEPKQK